MKHYHRLEQIPRPQPYVMSPAAHFVYLGLVVIGALTFFFTLKGDAERAWHNYLLNYFYWASLGVFGLFFVALQYITSSRWSVPLRRVPESFISFLPVVFLLTFPFIWGAHHLYEWTHHAVVAQDPILHKKSAYLNEPFFWGRTLLAISVWCSAGFWLIRNSLRQDWTGDPELTRKNKALSAPLLVFFGCTFTIFSFDFLMSLEPHWFSTIFGVYCFAGLFYSGMALTILFVLALKKQGALAEVVNENHLHDLGKLMFAFCVFWAYIAFSQYMLIWYGNLPEEIGYMMRRTEGAWTPVALALLFVKFVIPFFLLIGRPAKRNEGYLAFVSLWVLSAQYLDDYWMIFPMMGVKPVFGWSEIGIFLGFLGLFILTVTAFLQRVQPVPVRDPRLVEGVNLHQ